jgi:hypothetical protein
MTDIGSTGAEVPDEGTTATMPPGRGVLGLAALATGLVGVLVALSAWVLWLAVVPQERGSLDPELVDLIRLALGALWFAVLPAGALAMMFGIVARDHPERGPLARAGAYLGVLTVLVALSGVVLFLFAPTVVGFPPAEVYGAGIN